MVLVNVKVDISKLPCFEERKVEIQKRSLNLIIQDLLGNLQVRSPVDHGLLRKWFLVNTSISHVKIKTPAEYAGYVNDGTGPVYPKKGKVLAFKAGPKWDGPVTKAGKYNGWVFLKHSRGQKGQHFIDESIKDTRGRVEGLVIKATIEVFKK